MSHRWMTVRDRGSLALERMEGVVDSLCLLPDAEGQPCEGFGNLHACLDVLAVAAHLENPQIHSTRIREMSPFPVVQYTK